MSIEGGEPHADPGKMRTPAGPYRKRALALLLVGFGLTAGSGLLSEGVYHEDDLKHFLSARWSRHDGRYLLDEWSRPGFTVVYALPAMIGSATTGWHACRLLSAVLSAATAWVAYRIGRHYRLRHAWVAVPLVYLQPMFTHLSLTTLTETPMTFYLALATWLLLRERPIASAAVIALAPVTRYEGIVLLPIWAVALGRSRAPWPAYAAMWWALALQNLLACVYLESIPIKAFFEPAGATGYGTGTPFTFVPRLLLAAGPVVAVLAIMGVGRLTRRPGGWLVAAGALIYFCTETAIYMGGAYSSGGYTRFLVPITPWLAVLATAGAQPVFLAGRQAIRRRAVLAAGIVLIALWAVCEIEWCWRPPRIPENWHLAALVGRAAAAGFIALLAAALHRIRRNGRAGPKTVSRRFVTVAAAALLLAPPIWALIPLRLLPRHRIMREAAGELETQTWRQRPLITLNYWLYYWTGRWVPSHFKKWEKTLAEAQAGTLFAWDARFCPDPDFNLRFEELSHNPNWRQVWAGRAVGGSETPFVVLFERCPPPAATQPCDDKLKPA